MNDCPAKAGPPEYFEALPRRIDRSGSLSGTAATWPRRRFRATESQPSTASTFWSGIACAQKISGATRGARWGGPSVQSGDDVQPPPLDSEGRQQEAGKPAEWTWACEPGPAGVKGFRNWTPSPQATPPVTRWVGDALPDALGTSLSALVLLSCTLKLRGSHFRVLTGEESCCRRHIKHPCKGHGGAREYR